ncbi:MAG: hypothetical protein AAGF31_07160 [Planctomycetota bacterium]
MQKAANHADSAAIRLHQEGHTTAAIGLLDHAIASDPQNGSAWLVRAIIRHSQAEWRLALADAEMAMTLLPLPTGGQLVLADCYSHLNHHELAVVGYQHLLAQEDLPTDIYAGLYAGFRRCGRSDLALQACRASVAKEPENHAAHFGMAHCMAALNYSAVYIAGVLRTASKLAPDNAVYRTSLAIQLVRAGLPSDAYQELSQVACRDLLSIECRCSARKLMQLCVWANDAERASALGQVITKLSSNDRGQPGIKGSKR